jgi:hypothetical protein
MPSERPAPVSAGPADPGVGPRHTGHPDWRLGKSLPYAARVAPDRHPAEPSGGPRGSVADGRLRDSTQRTMWKFSATRPHRQNRAPMLPEETLRRECASIRQPPKGRPIAGGRWLGSTPQSGAHPSSVTQNPGPARRPRCGRWDDSDLTKTGAERQLRARDDRDVDARPLEPIPDDGADSISG